MLPVTDHFSYDYFGSDLVFGRGVVADLGDRLADRGRDRVLVVCGSNVGANDAVMDPVRDGLADRLVGVFDETTPAKSAETVFAGIDRVRADDPDVLVGLGGGSSLDIARQISAFAADGRSLGDLREAARTGPIDPPSGPAALPVAVVPTTFAGADLSGGGSIEVLSAADSPTGDPVRVGGHTMPELGVYDPDLFETTPMSALRGSAMNGFNKGIETVYAADPTPVTDATAVHGLRLLRAALPRLDDPAAMDRAVAGVLLVQFQRRTAIVHAVGHGFSYRYDVQQGAVHAAVVPHVLEYVFDNVDARRTLLAAGLGIDPAGRSEAELAAAIVAAVTELRDELGLPARLRDLGPTREADLPDIARFVRDDPTIERSPPGLDPSVEDIEAVLRAAW